MYRVLEGTQIVQTLAKLRKILSVGLTKLFLHNSKLRTLNAVPCFVGSCVIALFRVAPHLCSFWATVCKMVRPMLSVRCLSVCLSVSDVDIQWPNGCTDQDETWYGGWPRPQSHCVRCGPSSTPKGHSPPQFSAYVCCGQTAGWIKMPLGMKVGLSPGDIVLDGDPLPSPNRDQSPLIFGPCLLWLNGRPSQRLLSTCMILRCTAFQHHDKLNRCTALALQNRMPT